MWSKLDARRHEAIMPNRLGPDGLKEFWISKSAHTAVPDDYHAALASKPVVSLHNQQCWLANAIGKLPYPVCM